MGNLQITPITYIADTLIRNLETRMNANPSDGRHFKTSGFPMRSYHKICPCFFEIENLGNALSLPHPFELGSFEKQSESYDSAELASVYSAGGKVMWKSEVEARSKVASA